MKTVPADCAGFHPRRLWRWFLVVLSAGLCGCGSVKAWRVKTPAGAEIEQTGAVREPGRVDATRTNATTDLAPGSTVRLEPGGVVSVTMTAPAPLRVETTHETATGPAAFAPASPADLAKASGVRWFYLVGAASGVLAVVSVIRGHVTAAIWFGVGAVSLPIVGNLVGSTWAMVIAGATLAAGAMAFLAWHLIRLNPKAVAELQVEAKKRVRRLAAPTEKADPPD